MATVRKSPRVANLQSVQVAYLDGTIITLSGSGPWTLTADQAKAVEAARVDAGLGRLITPASDDNDIDIFGHSFTTPYLLTANQEWPSLLADFKGVAYNNFGVAGAQLTADETVPGGWSTVYNSQVLGRDAVLCYGVNDIAANGAGAAAVTGFKMALRAAITAARATTISNENAGGVSYPTGTWSDFGGAGFSMGGTLKAAGANGSCQLSVGGGFPGGSLSFFTAAAGSNGALYTFTLDGQAAGTLDTRGTTPRQDGKVVPYVKRFTDLAAGAHTLLVTVTNVVAAAFVDCFTQTTGTPPVVTVCNIAKSPNYSTIYGSGWFNVPTNAQIDTYNAAIASVVAEFPDARVADIDTALGADTTRLLGDNLHPNVEGHKRIAAAVANIVGH